MSRNLPIVGDVAMLKSGGFPMTVAEIRGSDARCVWAANGLIRERWLPLVGLMPSNDPKVIRLVMAEWNTPEAEVEAAVKADEHRRLSWG